MKSSILPQVTSYILIGIFLNISLYILFVVLIFFGIESKITISLCYALGLTFSFLLNKTFTFSNNSKTWKQLMRYLFLILCLYILNLFLLFLLVDKMSKSPTLIQGFIFISYIPITFILQKFWVFSD